ncbi:MAG: VOC family protein [Oscillospiraceae bacterium]|nr:VOC family protein [Oscillospiraceae bacterium]
MVGVEIDFVVQDCLQALPLYERIFEVERVEATAYQPGRNEAVFTIYGTRFHILDENPGYQLVAPKPGSAVSIWFNVLVPDIDETYSKAMAAGCAEIQPVTEMADFGVSNAMFRDPLGYVWMLHQIHRMVSFEERCEILDRKY